MAPVPFETVSSEVDDVRVVAVRGELDLSTVPSLEQPLDEALEGSRSVIIDLTECEFIDSTGIALIARAWQRIDAGEGDDRRLVICTGSDQVRRVLEISGLNLSIPVHPSRDRGLAALRDGATSGSA